MHLWKMRVGGDGVCSYHTSGGFISHTHAVRHPPGDDLKSETASFFPLLYLDGGLQK